MKLNKMREEMINSFIDCLKKDTIPWHRGWSSERPFNAVTNTEYHGANALWLTYNQQAQLYKDPRWCTFKQAQYLMPIPMTETNKVPHIVQNPGY